MPMTIFTGDGFHFRVRDGRVLLLWPTPGVAGAPFEMPVDPAWVDAVDRQGARKSAGTGARGGRSRGVVGGALRDVTRQARHSGCRAWLSESLPDQRVVWPRRDARAGAGSPAGGDHPRRRRVDARHRPRSGRRGLRRAIGMLCQSFCNCRLHPAMPFNLQSSICNSPSFWRALLTDRICRCDPASLASAVRARDSNNFAPCQRATSMASSNAVWASSRLASLLASRICPRSRCHSAANICWSVVRPTARAVFQRRLGFIHAVRLQQQVGVHLQVVRPQQGVVRRRLVGESGSDLGQAPFPLTRFKQRPAPHRAGPQHLLRDVLVGAEPGQFLVQREHPLRLAVQVVDQHAEQQDERQRLGMAQRAGLLLGTGDTTADWSARPSSSRARAASHWQKIPGSMPTCHARAL